MDGLEKPKTRLSSRSKKHDTNWFTHAEAIQIDEVLRKAEAAPGKILYGKLEGSLLDNVINWIANNLLPEQVFAISTLEEWAKREGCYSYEGDRIVKGSESQIEETKGDN